MLTFFSLEIPGFTAHLINQTDIENQFDVEQNASTDRFL